jgi:hypothetical protein
LPTQALILAAADVEKGCEIVCGEPATVKGQECNRSPSLITVVEGRGPLPALAFGSLDHVGLITLGPDRRTHTVDALCVFMRHQNSKIYGPVGPNSLRFLKLHGRKKNRRCGTHPRLIMKKVRIRSPSA